MNLEGNEDDEQLNIISDRSFLKHKFIKRGRIEMKKKNIKRLTAAVLSILIIMTILPMAAFAKNKAVESIDITVKKPMLNDAYSEEDKAYDVKIDEDCGLELVNESWLKLENKQGEGTPEFKKFEAENTYFILAFFKVKQGYKFPKDLSKIAAQINFTNAEKETPKYVPVNEYKYDNGTYTLDIDDPSPDTYLTFIYSVKINLKTADALNIKAKAPVSDVNYSKKGELLPEFEPAIEKGHGFKAGKSSWLYFNEEDKGIITEMFVPGGNYVLSVGVIVEDGYKLPDDIKKIPVTIDFDGGEKIVLTQKEYRDPRDFDPKEPGTYTIHEIKKDGKVISFDLIYATKPLFAVEKDIEFFYTNPVAGDEITPACEKYFFEANSADGVAVAGTNWEEKLFGSIYKPAKEFNADKNYRVTVILYVKDGYELPKNLKDVKITLTDEKMQERVLDSKDFKLVPYKISGVKAGYKFIYELPNKPVKLPVEDVTAAPEEPSTQAEAQTQAPDTGAAAGTMFIGLLTVGAVTAYATKKRKIK